jgi:hypothetical protein
VNTRLLHTSFCSRTVQMLEICLMRRSRERGSAAICDTETVSCGNATMHCSVLRCCWNAGQPGVAGPPGNNLATSSAAFSPGKPVPGTQQARARRTPEELAASYQVCSQREWSFMCEPACSQALLEAQLILPGMSYDLTAILIDVVGVGIHG